MLRKVEKYGRLKYNLIVGGWAGMSKATFAIKNNIPQSNISYFESIGPDLYVRCLPMTMGAAIFNLDYSLTFVKDFGVYTNINRNSFRLAENCKYIELKSVESIQGTGITNAAMARIDIRKCTDMQSHNFYGVEFGCELHIHEIFNTVPLNSSLTYLVSTRSGKVYFYNDLGYITATINV